MAMQIQVNTDRNLDGSEAFTRYIEAEAVAALGKFGDQITRVEIHLSDPTGGKAHGSEVRCLMEARLAARQPVAVTHEAATMNDAVDGATKKLVRLLESSLGRLHDHKGGASIRTDEPS